MTDSPNDTNPVEHSAIEGVFSPIAQRLSTPAREFVAAAVVLALVVLAAYSNIFASDLQSDERALVEKSLSGAASRDLPLMAAIDVGIEARLFGFNALGYRLVALGLHLLAAIAAYGIARRLAPAGVYGWLIATLAAAIFAAHPAATHAVDTLRARPELLGSAFALTGIALMLSAALRSDRGQWLRASLSWALLAAGCAANPAASLAAPMLPALEYASRRRVTWALQIPAIATIVLVGLARSMTNAAIHENVTVGTTTHTIPALKILVAPLELIVYHAPAESSGIIAWVVLLVAGLAAYALLPSLGVAVLWFALAVRLAHYGEHTSSFDEATMHLAVAALTLLVTFVLSLPRTPAVRAVTSLLVFLTLLGSIALASTRNNTWRSEAALWLQAHEACPECAIPAERLARLHYEQAMRELSATSPVQPSALPPDVPGHLELVIELSAIADSASTPAADRAVRQANALQLLGRIEESGAALAHAVSSQPADVHLLAARADSAFDGEPLSRGEAHRAIWGYRSAMERGGLTNDSRLRYAHALARIGNWRETLELLRSMDAAANSATEALASEAAARLQSAQAAQSAYAQAAQRLSPADRAAIIGTVLVAQGHVQLGDQIAQAAVARYPGATTAWMTAALAQRHLDRLDEFIAAGVPASVGDDVNSAWNNLAVYFVRSGEPVAAELVLRDALALSEFGACMRVAELATDAQRTNIAAIYLRRAAELDTANPAPWLELAELAITAQQLEAARDAIANAERRGADPVVLNEMKSRAGIAESDVQGLRRTIIR